MTEKDYLTNKIQDEIWYCLQCMMCKATCTTHHYTRREEDAPEPRVHLVELVRRGILDWDKTSAETIFHCNLCGLCREWCASKQDIPTIMTTARADVVNLGLAPDSVVSVDESLNNLKNAYGKPLDERFNDIPLAVSSIKDAEVIYFIGCLSGYDRQEIPNAMIKILEVAGVKYTVLKGEEWCCGLPAYQLGLRDRAKEMSEHNAKFITTTGIKTIIASCPGCARSLKLEYPKWETELKAEVLHHTEFIKKLLDEGRLKLKKSIAKKLTYHDPCHLGRDMEIYDAPREILKQVSESEVLEMFTTRERALCCGSGGGYKLTNPEQANNMGSRITDEAAFVKADILVSACPLCKESFSKDAGEKGLELKDIAELINELL
ncbi:MAG: (Fe-S)-binding protein [Candidatus Hodarchaeales archaeon]|jgi:Fe-S oxidoreductase